MKYFVHIGSHEYEVEVNNDQVTVDGQLVTIDLEQSGGAGLYSLLFNNESHELLITADRFNYTVALHGEQFQVQVEDERTRRLNSRRKPPVVGDGELAIVAPIPGLVVKVLVKEGDEIHEDQPLIILEAMKMENELRAARKAKVQKINVSPGQRVEQNALLLLME